MSCEMCSTLPHCLFIWLYIETDAHRSSLCKVILSGSGVFVVTKVIKDFF